VCMSRWSCCSFTRYVNRYSMRMRSCIRCVMITDCTPLSRFIRYSITICCSFCISYIVEMVSSCLSNSSYSERINSMCVTSTSLCCDVDIVYVRLDWVQLFT
jgi:hypothetical protein